MGLGCAKQLAAEQCRVAICSRDGIAAKKAAENIAGQTNAEVVGFGADVNSAEDISRLLGEVKNSLGNPDILVTNAGGPPPGTFASTALEEYEIEPDLPVTIVCAFHNRTIEECFYAFKLNG